MSPAIGCLKFSNVRVGISTAINGNFVRLPANIVHILEGTSIPVQEFGVEICSQNRVWYLGWDGYSSEGSINGDTVDVHPLIARELGLQNGENVDLSIKKYGSDLSAAEVYVEPVTSADWEIVERNADFLQDEILHQTRLVSVDRTILCFIDRIVCKLQVHSIIPENLNHARLTSGTLIIISPKENKTRLPSQSTKNIENKLHTKTVAIKRCINIPNLITSGLCAYMEASETSYAFISLSENPLKNQKKTEKDKPSPYARKILAKIEPVDIQSDNIPKNSIVISPLLQEALLLSWSTVVGTLIRVEFIDIDTVLLGSEDDTSIILRQVTIKNANKTKNHNDDLAENIQALAEKLDNTVVTDNMLFPMYNIQIEVRAKYEQNNPKCAHFRLLKSQKAEERRQGVITLPNAYFKEEQIENIVAMDDTINKMVKFCTKYYVPASCLMITGTTGMGKTSVLKKVGQIVAKNHCKYVKYTNCEEIFDKSNVKKLADEIEQWCLTCYWRMPAILILDNADSLFPTVKHEDPQQQALLQSSASYSTRLSSTLINIVESITSKVPYALRVIISCKSSSSINSIFENNHFIFQQLKLRPPSRDVREALIKYRLEQKEISLGDDIEHRDIAIETEGYSPLDISTLADRIFYQLQLQPVHHILNRSTFNLAIDGYVPSSLRGVSLTKNTGISWKDIGALEQAKSVLLKTLEWPTKYAAIFQNCPLRLTSGILLYGYTGCGKTLLASAVAEQCGLNFITIKGPEILNKYIGASEQSVRELFERAQAAKPCILFFDEFDSIAPKRGHDSTGITDRIVNQLLTQMDGAEGLDGVYVLAATSRPDLLDSALLRPGRLDKSIICDLPNTQERLEILQAIMRKQAGHYDDKTLKSTLKEIASKTERYTGADLQGLYYNAYLKAVHRVLAKQDDNIASTATSNYLAIFPEHPTQAAAAAAAPPPSMTNENTTMQKDKTSIRNITISREDFLQACEESEPSISMEEFRKLNLIYRRFKQDREGNMPTGTAPNEIGSRTSLV